MKKLEKEYQRFEQEGFAETFWTLWPHYEQYVGQKFQVLGRASIHDEAENMTPAWELQMENGDRLIAHAEEVVASEQMQAQQSMTDFFV